jgi:AAA15 family ATPase/GTPase
MYIKKLTLKNFKAHKGEQVFNFKIPSTGGDGKTNGLNILIGDNNAGKSSVFEAMDFLRDGLPREKELNDVRTKEIAPDEETAVEITFVGKIKELIEEFSETKFEKYVIEDDGIQSLRVRRSSKESSITQNGKSIQIDHKKIGIWNKESQQFENPAGIDKAFTALFEVDFIWADTNPQDIVNFGATKICGKLLSRIAKGFFQSEQWTSFETAHKKTFHEGDDSLSGKAKEIETRVRTILASQFSDAKLRFDFRLPESDSFFKNTRVVIGDGEGTTMEEEGSGMQRAVALALLQVYAEDLIKHPDNGPLEKPFFLFIDEPEICLHPKAQFTLLAALKKISETRQLFIATHSPFMFKDISPKSSGVFSFVKDSSKIAIKNLEIQKWELFPWGTTWNQINYFAYGLPTPEFHNELYGFLQERENIYVEPGFEAFLLVKGAAQDKPYIQVNKDGGLGKPRNITLCTYIRHQIHHPENKHNPTFTDEELRISTDMLIGIVQEVGANPCL